MESKESGNRVIDLCVTPRLYNQVYEHLYYSLLSTVRRYTRGSVWLTGLIETMVMKTVTEIARSFNVTTETIRHYTKLGLLSPDKDEANGYRRYGQKDETLLRFLLSAKKLGFTLKDIREILGMAASGDTPCPLVRQLIDERLAVVRQEMKDAHALLSRMEAASERWRQLPDQLPSGESICHLIEAWDDNQIFSEGTSNKAVEQ